MKTTLQKWGNSLGVRIPGSLAKSLSLHPGTVIEITIENDHIVLYPKKYSLSDMLSMITEENKHHLEWNDEDVRGTEEW
jgi:antitoxin MazE